MKSLISRNILNESRINANHLSQKFLIILAKNSLSNTEMLNESFQILWKSGLINSHVLSHEGNKLWSLYAYMPFQRDCFTLNYYKIATFTPFNFTNSMTIPMAQLYPRKLKNFNKCPLHVAVSIIDPLTLCVNTSDGKCQFRGIDIEIMNQISTNLNFDAVYLRSMDGSGHGVILPNKTVTGNMNLVFILTVKNDSILLICAKINDFV